MISAIRSNQISASSQFSSQTTPKQSAPEDKAATDSVQIGQQQRPESYIVVAKGQQLEHLALASGLQVEKELGKAGDATYLLVQADQRQAAALAESHYEVLPNYQYDSSNLYDEPLASNDSPAVAQSDSRPVHLDIISIKPAWNVTTGQANVVAAITDTGADLAHPQLKESVWVNPKEIAANGLDDDGNGRIDDINGWDFTDSDANPADTASSHHTHVHGIIAARPNPSKSQEATSGGPVSGVAPGAKAMALRVSGGKRPFSSAVLVESYLYALNSGAKSINTSFNIDSFVNDSAIKSVYTKLADNDVLLFNSAGNNSKRNPARQVFEDIVLVASTDTAVESRDKLSSYSNFGTGIDIAAPGADILSTLPNGRTGKMSGTSMASPVALGVDLLVQSAHPDWNRSQRWAQIAGTADNVDSVNPEHAGELGYGRVNAGRALTESLPAPTITVKPNTFPNGQTMNLVVGFDKVLDPASANHKDAWRVLNEQGETVMQGAPKEVRLLTNGLDFNVSTLPTGKYQFVASAAHLKDPFGQPLDGNKDGLPGDDVVVNFQRI